MKIDLVVMPKYLILFSFIVCDFSTILRLIMDLFNSIHESHVAIKNVAKTYSIQFSIKIC